MVINVIYPGKYCLAGNPFIFQIESDRSEQIDLNINVNQSTVELSVYTSRSRNRYIAEIDISDIVQSFFTNNMFISGYGGIIVPVYDFLLECQVIIAGQEYIFDAINGGISDELDSLLHAIEQDPFSHRLCNSSESLFLFTTRSYESVLRLRKSELYPFTFIHPGKNISFQSPSGNTINAGSIGQGTACEMDIEILLKEFNRLYNEEPLIIQVLVDKERCFEILIEEDAPTEILHRILFKNSLGGYEVIAITGHPSYKPILSKPIEYQITDRGYWENRRKRTSLKHIISTHTGYKSEEELMWVLDMICSDECYWISSDGSMRKINVSVDGEISIPTPIITPQSINLKLESVSDSLYYSPKTNIVIPNVLLLGTEDYDIIASEKYEALQLN